MIVFADEFVEGVEGRNRGRLGEDEPVEELAGQWVVGAFGELGDGLPVAGLDRLEGGFEGSMGAVGDGRAVGLGAAGEGQDKGQPESR